MLLLRVTLVREMNKLASAVDRGSSAAISLDDILREITEAKIQVHACVIRSPSAMVCGRLGGLGICDPAVTNKRTTDSSLPLRVPDTRREQSFILLLQKSYSLSV